MSQVSSSAIRLFVVLTLSLSASLVFSGPVSAQETSPTFTVRYVLFLAEPQQFDYNEFVRSGRKLPKVFQQLQNGSNHSMAPTPEGFLDKLRSAEAGYNFRLILSGSAVCRSGSGAIIEAGPHASDSFGATLSDNILLVQNSPATVSMRHNGAFAFTLPDSTARHVISWNSGVLPKAVLGCSYSQGVLTLPDGRRLIYAFSILKGDVDNISSLWNSGPATNKL